MSYPKSKKTAKLYADYLSDLHNKKFLPIERKDKIKNPFTINFAAAEEGEELTDFITNGWEIIE